MPTIVHLSVRPGRCAASKAFDGGVSVPAERRLDAPAQLPICHPPRRRSDGSGRADAGQGAQELSSLRPAYDPKILGATSDGTRHGLAKLTWHCEGVTELNASRGSGGWLAVLTDRARPLLRSAEPRRDAGLRIRGSRFGHLGQHFGRPILSDLGAPPRRSNVDTRPSVDTIIVVSTAVKHVEVADHSLAVDHKALLPVLQRRLSNPAIALRPVGAVTRERWLSCRMTSIR